MDNECAFHVPSHPSQRRRRRARYADAAASAGFRVRLPNGALSTVQSSLGLRCTLHGCLPEGTDDDGGEDTSHVQVAELDGEIVGVARLSFEGGHAELAALFVDPALQRSGIGRALLDWAKAECHVQKATRMTIEADPGAAPFYRRMGARDVGSAPSGSIRGRSFPGSRSASGQSQADKVSDGGQATAADFLQFPDVRHLQPLTRLWISPQGS